MGLYNREYSNTARVRTFENETALINFVKTTYKFFAASLLLATIGAIIGLFNFNIVMSNRWLFFIAEIAAFFGLMFTRNKPGLNIAMLFIFTTLSGVTLVPLLGFVISVRGLSAVWQALGMTTIVFAAMSIFALKTTKDLANMGKMLFIAVIVVIIASIINIFLGNSGFQLIIAGAATIIFSLMVAYDTQNIVRGLYASPIDAAVSLYLNFLNILISLLQILGITGNNNR
ncbi:MAG: Bax inhibitor-1/YccA family protein [Helicobacter sp.]|nr:Bax inhibitor-1/YccA family protein [Helicobacter sp.]